MRPEIKLGEHIIKPLRDRAIADKTANIAERALNQLEKIQLSGFFISGSAAGGLLTVTGTAAGEGRYGVAVLAAVGALTSASVSRKYLREYHNIADEGRDVKNMCENPTSERSKAVWSKHLAEKVASSAKYFKNDPFK